MRSSALMPINSGPSFYLIGEPDSLFFALEETAPGAKWENLSLALDTLSVRMLAMF